MRVTISCWYCIAFEVMLLFLVELCHRIILLSWRSISNTGKLDSSTSVDYYNVTVIAVQQLAT